MRPELDDALCRAYPELFADRHGDKHSTGMVWGFECRNGWYGIIWSLCELLAQPLEEARSEYERLREAEGRASLSGGSSVSEHEVAQAKQVMLSAAASLPRVRQVKEKLGTLRFRVDVADERTRALVEFAERHSARVREICGAQGDGVRGAMCTLRSRRDAYSRSCDLAHGRSLERRR